MFGFIRIKIRIDEKEKIPLAVKRVGIGLTNPVGMWTGFYFSSPHPWGESL